MIFRKPFRSPASLVFFLRTKPSIFSDLSLKPVALLSSVTHLLLLRFTFQNHRNVRPAVIFHLDRTELGSELIYVGTVERNLGVRRG
ncbi:hypothetical protein LR48_Vigan08g006400 [Vigna angularis]|uniref:Uncharacterized protein n=1 Tax=Phaseolus angularis TaxID=3914 RepID=A0A0L9V2W1_PHAAN|nr:hypothetical protein LR48_Vigan08g006400 [Vigna angularis]